ncbi:hypothetical protein ACFC34_00320 [Streptomyces sp. NPDC056053]|uniref:hypothetical protein n=1 Tax=Streptomyces sp. NPDC056053 TaxID=3345696 RepID=UPI0035E276EA
MRANQGQWRIVATYPASYSAASAGFAIRAGNATRNGFWYGPPGAFDARTETVDDGTALYARYVGGGTDE